MVESGRARQGGGDGWVGGSTLLPKYGDHT
jgi:hypothetical protein